MVCGALTMLVANSPAAAQSALSGYRGWVGGFAGITPGSANALTLGWEAWASRGFLGLGYQRHFLDDFDGTRRSAHAILPGVIIPYGRAIGRLAGGVAAARSCVKEGEQSGQGACRSASTGELAVSVDVALSSAIGFHTSYFTIPNRSVGHSGVVFGLSVGRLSLPSR